MPLTDYVSFKAVIQKKRRIQIPVEVKRVFNLKHSEIFQVDLKLGYHREGFLCLREQGRARAHVRRKRDFSALKRTNKEICRGYHRSNSNEYVRGIG